MKRYLIKSITITSLMYLPFALAQAQTPATINYLQLSYHLTHETNLSPQAIQMAFAGYKWALQHAAVHNKNILTIVDFSLPSNKDRLYVINLRTGKILLGLPVTHGVNSGKNSRWATRFSNSDNSLESSIGVFLTENPYYGKFGFSMRINGLESSNNHVLERNVVVHSANYASRDFLNRYGMLGNTWGCFAVDPKNVKQLIGYIEDGSVMYAYGQSSQYLTSTKILNTNAA